MLFNSSNGIPLLLQGKLYGSQYADSRQSGIGCKYGGLYGQWVIVSIENPYNDDVPIEKVYRTRDETEIPFYNYWIRNGRILIVDHYEEDLMEIFN